VLYADACSGVAGAPHEANFAAVNTVLRRLAPAPEFILFPGDEIVGLVADAGALRAQWRHWLDVEMAWLDRTAMPLFHATCQCRLHPPQIGRLKIPQFGVAAHL